MHYIIDFYPLAVSFQVLLQLNHIESCQSCHLMLKKIINPESSFIILFKYQILSRLLEKQRRYSNSKQGTVWSLFFFRKRFPGQKINGF